MDAARHFNVLLHMPLQYLNQKPACAAHSSTKSASQTYSVVTIFDPNKYFCSKKTSTKIFESNFQVVEVFKILPKLC